MITTDVELARVMKASENVGYKKAKLDLAERIVDLHKPSEIAAEVILWLKEDLTKDEANANQ